MTKQLNGISGEERASRQAAIAFARCSVRLEGIVLPPTLLTLNQSFIRGEIDDAEYTKACLAVIAAG
jgi:hypothetical protein